MENESRGQKQEHDMLQCNIYCYYLAYALKVKEIGDLWNTAVVSEYRVIRVLRNNQITPFKVTTPLKVIYPL